MEAEKNYILPDFTEGNTSQRLVRQEVRQKKNVKPYIFQKN